MRGFLLVILCGLLSGTVVSAAPGAQEQKEEPKPAPEKEKRSPKPLLLFGTVFTEQGFTLPGAQIEVRRAGEKKVRGRARSDRRGEFAIRLPSGAKYEVKVAARDYQEQTRTVDSAGGGREDLVFRMRPARSVPSPRGEGEGEPQ